MRFLIFIALFISFSIAEAVTFLPLVQTTATVTSTKVMAANGKRIYLLIVNTGAVAIVVKPSSTIQSSATDGITIPAGGNYEPIQAPTNDIWIRTASSTASITVVQGQ